MVTWGLDTPTVTKKFQNSFGYQLPCGECDPWSAVKLQLRWGAAWVGRRVQVTAAPHKQILGQGKVYSEHKNIWHTLYLYLKSKMFHLPCFVGKCSIKSPNMLEDIKTVLVWVTDVRRISNLRWCVTWFPLSVLSGYFNTWGGPMPGGRSWQVGGGGKAALFPVGGDGDNLDCPLGFVM